MTEESKQKDWERTFELFKLEVAEIPSKIIPHDEIAFTQV